MRISDWSSDVCSSDLLGIDDCVAFDVAAVCSGFLYAVQVADSMLRAGVHRRALVIGAETFSRLLDWEDRGTCVLFGDGAGAIVLEAQDSDDATGRGILTTQIGRASCRERVWQSV